MPPAQDLKSIRSQLIRKLLQASRREKTPPDPAYRIVVREVSVGLESCCIDELNNSVNHVHAIAKTTEASEEAPREEVIDQTTVAIVTGPDNPSDGQGPGAATEWLKDGTLPDGRVGCVGQNAPEGTPHVSQHGSESQYPAGDDPVLGQRDLTTAIACEQEVAEDDANQPGGNTCVCGVVGQTLAQIDMIVLDAEQCEVIM